jgi:SAM-dependent methyltransferase
MHPFVTRSLEMSLKPSHLIGKMHGPVFSRRIEVLTKHIAGILPEDARVLDVGCGDGTIAARLSECLPSIRLHGIDVLVRPETKIPVEAFDGQTIPFLDKSFDFVMFVDVLHHTDDPMVLLTEAVRVARRAIVIKDHLLEGLFAGPTLRLMDYVGNARYEVALPYNYWPRRRWQQAFQELRLKVEDWQEKLGLYPWPAGLIFGRSLHFIALLEPEPSAGYL